MLALLKDVFGNQLVISAGDAQLFTKVADFVARFVPLEQLMAQRCRTISAQFPRYTGKPTVA